MTIISYDRSLAAGLVEAVEHGEEIRSAEFFEHLIIEGKIDLRMDKSPLAQVLEYIGTINGCRALHAWAKDEAIDEAMAV